MSTATPLRLLFVGEGVLGHRTMAAQMEATLAGNPAVEASFATVPPPGRLARLLLRRWRRIGDADLYELRWRLRWSWQARRLLKRHAGSVDAAVITTQASALLSRRPMRRLPCFLSIDATVRQFTALEYGGPRDSFSPLQDRVLARLERRAIAAAAGVVAWTDWTAKALRGDYGIEAPRLATIHPGLDAEWWSRAAARRATDRTGPLRVLFVGNDVERKGLDLLIEAVSRPELEAVLDVVTGEDVPETDSVRVHPGVEARSERLRDLYARADAFALPTKADATPWAVIEAMAAGLPVVATRVGAIAELLGDAAEPIEPGNAGELERALAQLADPELRRTLGSRGLERVRERYDSEIQARRLVELVGAAVDAAGGKPAPERRFRRRTLLAAGAGVAGVAIAAPYLALLPDDEFEQLVASKLGIEPPLAGQLLEHARDQYGDAEYDARAAAFAFAVRDPAASVLPGGVREKAISALIEPMLSTPAASLAYAISGTDPGYPAACAGLVRGG